MLCLLDRNELCWYEACRYYHKGSCLLENIDELSRPSKKERARTCGEKKLAKAVYKTEYKSSKK